jgi:general secretion pathway protein N
MKWRSLFAGLTASLALFGQAAALVVTPPVVDDLIGSDGEPGAISGAPATVPPANGTSPPSGEPAPAAERAPAGNPLWAIPLKRLTVTRERPIFSPSRRPPPPVVAATPYVPPVVAKPAEPDRPLLALVGTVASAREAFGIFLDQGTNNVIRLRMGEAHKGWILRSVQGREATLQKGRETAVLTLPARSAAPPPLPTQSAERAERPVARRLRN